MWSEEGFFFFFLPWKKDWDPCLLSCSHEPLNISDELQRFRLGKHHGQRWVLNWAFLALVLGCPISRTWSPCLRDLVRADIQRLLSGAWGLEEALQQTPSHIVEEESEIGDRKSSSTQFLKGRTDCKVTWPRARLKCKPPYFISIRNFNLVAAEY